MPDVLVFDDDPSIGDLAEAVLAKRGLSVEHHLSGAGAVDLIAAGKPKLVLLDIMMQGVDGLTVCKQIKSDARTAHVKVAVVSSKKFKHEQARALKYGADRFLGKPLTPEVLDAAAADLLKLGDAPAAAAGAGAKLHLLPGSAVLAEAGHWTVFDAGAGLAGWVGAQRALPERCAALLTRFEPEAVRGLSALAAFLKDGRGLRLAAPETPEGDLQQIAPQTRPSGSGALPALHPLREGDFRLGDGCAGRAQYTNHPGTTLAYRVESGGKSVVWCPAHTMQADPAHEMEKFIRFFRGADVLVHGLPAGAERGAVEAAAREAGVKRLVLTPLAAPQTFEL